MPVVRVYQRELMALGLAIVVVWFFRTVVLGEMKDEIRELSAPAGVPAKRELMNKVLAAERDAKTIASQLDAIRRYPLPGVNLASTLERFGQEHSFRPPRARLIPRNSQELDGSIQEEMVDVAVNEVSLQEIIQYLSGMETLGPSVRLRSVKIQKTGDTATLMLTVAALKVL